VATNEGGVLHPGAPRATDALGAHDELHGETRQDFHQKQVLREGDAGGWRRRCDRAAFLRPMKIHLDPILGRSFFFFFFLRKGWGSFFT
jgi:hypothetical protein